MAEQNNVSLKQMQVLEQALDDYESKIGLPKFSEQTSYNDAFQYLSFTREQMEKLGVEDCAEIALLLSGFAFYLQRCLNRETARANWAENKLKNLIAGKEQQYKGSWESQFAQAVKEDDFAKDLLKLKNYAKQRADRLTFLASSVKNIRDDFKNLQIAKAMK